MENEEDYVDPFRFPNHIPKLFLTGKRMEGRGGEEIGSQEAGRVWEEEGRREGG